MDSANALQIVVVGYDLCFDDLRQIWEFIVEVAISLRLDLALVRPLPAIMDLPDDLHAIAFDLPERRETLVVEESVVHVIDEELAGTRVRRACLSECHPADLV